MEKILKVRKNNGKLVDFDTNKIKDAIQAAAKAIKQDIPDATISRIANDVENEFRSQKDLVNIKAEDISELVENKLMASNYKDTARCYIRYRYDRDKERMYKSDLIKQFKRKLEGTNIENQNANLDEHTFSGKMNEANRVLMKEMALDSMSKMARDNHNNNIIYIHDLDSYSAGLHNCLSIPIDKLLEKGFISRNCDIRPPKSIDAAIQLIIAVMQIQSIEQFGGVSATHIDWTMVPYIRHSFFKHYRKGMKYLCNEDIKKVDSEKIIETSIEDENFYPNKKARQYALDLTIEDLQQGFESFIHECNLLAVRAGGQLPFSSINYGTCTLKEGQLCIDAILDATLAGTGKIHKTAIFPCGIFQYKKGVNDKPGTPNYELFQKALKSTALRFYPNYANVDWSVDVAAKEKDRKFKKDILDNLSETDYDKLLEALKNNPVVAKKLSLIPNKNKIEINMEPLPEEMFSTMGCRTSNGYDIWGEDSIKANIDCLIKGKPLYDDVFSCCIKDGRGNICPVTIILPTLAMEADKDVEKFMALLDKKISEAKDMLLERFNHICEQPPSSASFMYGNGTMGGYIPEEGIRSALRHGTTVIGQLGLAEALQLLLGCDQTTAIGMELAKRIEQLYNSRCAEFKAQYHQNFGVYLTPAENLSYTALKKFREKYGVIKDVSDKDFFTNSMHVPVWKQMTPFQKIDIEAQLTGLSNAGCITYIELDSVGNKNIKAMEDLVNYAMEKDIPYFALNPAIDQCAECGYSGVIGDKCPKCNSKLIIRIRRITGYLVGSLEFFNFGKKKEVENRVIHRGNIDC